MIEIYKDPNADSRTANQNFTKDDLSKATKMHIEDVAKGLNFFADMLREAGKKHDSTKMKNINEFYEALRKGNVKETDWYKKHITEERHHLLSNVADDVNFIDIIEFIVDCTMAGLARSGTIYDADKLPAETLQLAYMNTLKLIKDNVEVKEKPKDVLDEEIEN